MSYQLTKKEIVRELIKCGKDPVYFIDNFCKIAHPDEGLISFKLYPFQIECIRQFVDYRYNVILKSRQLGLSTAAAGFTLWMILFHREKTVLTVATKLGTAAGMVKKVKVMYRHIPDWMKTVAKPTSDNKNAFELSNGSWVRASSTTGDSGRGDALSLLIVDEAGAIPNMDEMWEAVYPTIATGGRCIAISTPKGVGNWFHKTYTDAETQQNNFNPIKLNWDVHPDRDSKWFENETKNLNSKSIAQEYECSFNFSGDTVISGEILEEIAQNISPPTRKGGFDGNLWYWKEPEEGKRYMLVADVARGDAEDNSAFHIFDVDSMEQVAEYCGKLSPDVYAELLFTVSKEFGFCLTVVENNSFGYGVLEKLKDMKHPSIYHHKKTSYDFIEPLDAVYQEGAVPGFTTNVKMRPLAIAKFEELVRNKAIKINSERSIREIRTFVWNNSKAEAIKGYNDDLVISCAIACWVREGALIISQRDVSYRKAVLSSMRVGGRTFDSSIPGMSQHADAEKKRRWAESYNQAKEFSWLLR
jgi:hypothetical protein